MQKAGYFVVLLFVGLQSVEMSIARVASRLAKGGHDVPLDRLRKRFPKTQQAIRHASQIADLTVMFDNSRREKKAFALARAQRKTELLYDCRDLQYKSDPALRIVAEPWLIQVSGDWTSEDTTANRTTKSSRLKK